MNFDNVFANLQKVLTYDPSSPIIFSSGLFLVLFVCFSLIYYMLRNRDTARILFVTAFSYYFYYKSSGLCFLLLAAVTVSDYVIAHFIWKAKTAGWDRRTPKLLLVLSLVIDLGFLFYFKYTNFFAGMIADILGNNFQPWDIFLPVGISFFTFQSLSYTIDVYRGRLQPLTRLIDYAFYISFFPQLVAGPIVRASDFAPQIRRKLNVSDSMIARGVFMIVVGLFKKAVISDYISLNFVDRIFENPSLYTGFENLLGLYGYALQIYCDFSGYSDMAIGIALLLGFHFPKNFDAPFKSSGIGEFWHRWHISLSSWIKDYVYIFWMGGNRKGKRRTYVNLVSSMLLCGLWHGASLNFVIWGGIHGLAVAGQKFLSAEVFKHPKHYVSTGFRKYMGMFLTFQFVAFTFMIFRMPTWQGVGDMCTQIFCNFHPELMLQVLVSYKYVFLIILFGYVTHFVPDSWCDKATVVLKKGGMLVQVFLILAVIYVVMQVKSSEIQPFIYFQF